MTVGMGPGGCSSQRAFLCILVPLDWGVIAPSTRNFRREWWRIVIVMDTCMELYCVVYLRSDLDIALRGAAHIRVALYIPTGTDDKRELRVLLPEAALTCGTLIHEL